jgi:hypothetical protein
MAKSQSALEYLVTYGWAILLIVAAIAILYALGFFNPSSSIYKTTVISGFSGVKVASAFANSSIFQFDVLNEAGVSVSLINSTLTIDRQNYTSITCTDMYISNGQNSPCSLSIALGNGTEVNAALYIFYQVPITDNSFRTLESVGRLTVPVS